MATAQTTETVEMQKKPYGKALSKSKADMKAAYYDPVCDASAYKSTVIDPLVSAVKDLTRTAYNLGRMSMSGDSVTIDGKEVDKNTLNSLTKAYITQLNELSRYHSEVLRNGKPKKVKSQDEEDSTRLQKAQNATFNKLWKYDARLGEFFADAAKNNTLLAGWSELTFCKGSTKTNEYFAVAPQKLLTTLINTYVRANRLACQLNGNMIIPDDLMRKHFGKEIDVVLENQKKNNPTQSENYEGMLLRVRFSSVWPLLRLREEECDEKVASVLNDPSAREIYDKDFVAASAILDALRKEDEESKPKKVKENKGATFTIRQRVESELTRIQGDMQQGVRN